MSAPNPILLKQPWLRAPQTRAVMAALTAAGGEDCARFVGGCVRNALMGYAVDDVDIATRLTPAEVIVALEAARLKAVPTGVDYGTVTAVASGRPFEITTLRRDVETDGRRAVVAFTTDWSEDAGRRDFRLNALYADAAGVLFDPTGQGMADALAGRIVFVGDAATRITEDALRILRFFRFQAWYGRGEPDAAALSACARMKTRITQLSAERIAKEMLKLLATPDPRAVLRLMVETGVMGEISPGFAGPLTALDQLVEIEIHASVPCDPLLRLAALLPDAGAVGALRLRLSNAQRDRLVAALTVFPADPRDESGVMRADLTPREARRLIYRLGADVFQDRLLLAWAASDARDAAPWSALLSLARTWPRPTFPLTGADALAAGVAKGPQVGALLREVEVWWIDQDFNADRGALEARLRAAAGG